MKPPLPPTQPADTRTLPLETRISNQARTLWESYGRPEGRDVAIWLEAERQVLGVDSRVNQQAGGAVAEPALHDALTPESPRASTPDGGTVVVPQLENAGSALAATLQPKVKSRQSSPPASGTPAPSSRP